MSTPFVWGFQASVVDRITPGTTRTYENVSITTGADQVLLVLVAFEGGTASTLTGVTWNGSALTRATFAESSGCGASVWYLSNPTPATGDLVFTSDANMEAVFFDASLLSNANTASPIRDADSAQGPSSPSSLSLTRVSGDSSVLNLACAPDTTVGFTHGSGQTERGFLSSGTYFTAVTTVKPAFADPTVMSETWSGSHTVSHVAVVIAQKPPEYWVDIADFVDQEISGDAFPGGAARVLGEIWSEDTGSPLPVLKSRIVSLLTTRDVNGKLEIDAEVARSAEVSSAVPASNDFAVTLSGTKRHKLQVTSDPLEVDIFWIGRGVGP